MGLCGELMNGNPRRCCLLETQPSVHEHRKGCDSGMMKFVWREERKITTNCGAGFATVVVDGEGGAGSLRDPVRLR